MTTASDVRENRLRCGAVQLLVFVLLGGLLDDVSDFDSDLDGFDSDLDSPPPEGFDSEDLDSDFDSDFASDLDSDLESPLVSVFESELESEEPESFFESPLASGFAPARA
ncbi:MAG: hypothetical protein M3Y27_25880 [Acidobacteriota bacterium]|nr:hypothetical protein [Acidobacteriota bacterium]